MNTLLYGDDPKKIRELEELFRTLSARLLGINQKQAEFVVDLIRGAPDISDGEIEYLRGSRLKDRLELVKSTLPELFERYRYGNKGLELIEVDPRWGFLILRSSEYPEVGIAACERSGALGVGLRLALRTEYFDHVTNEWVGESYEPFLLPCGCCQFFPGEGVTNDVSRHRMLMRWMTILRARCHEEGVSRLLLSNWGYSLRQGKDGLILVNPFEPTEMNHMNHGVEKERFLNAFAYMGGYYLGNERVPLSRLFDTPKQGK